MTSIAHARATRTPRAKLADDPHSPAVIYRSVSIVRALLIGEATENSRAAPSCPVYVSPGYNPRSRCKQQNARGKRDSFSQTAPRDSDIP